MSAQDTFDLPAARPRERRKATATAGAAPHIGGMLWLAGWLFTIGFGQLVWWKALLGIIAWPYFLGLELRP